MKLTIGVMGSSGGALTKEVGRQGFRLGQAIAEQGAVRLATMIDSAR